MNFVLNKRAIDFGKYILRTKSTVRYTAEVFGISKSTVHFDVSKRLKKVDFSLYEKVHKILENNFSEKHIRGGESTKNKYLKLNN
ncbi:MAG: sporulation transcriptional regulator SpoIIID [Clostridia bacterium]|nr:sporulation transcriptional regulator SpoIIID [Clostridia bacterium]MDD4685982.1 sporulation transcriptional regulator SpoIIID [Clostridia bacterium]